MKFFERTKFERTESVVRIFFMCTFYARHCLSSLAFLCSECHLYESRPVNLNRDFFAICYFIASL